MAAPDGTVPDGITRSRLESISDGVIAVAITLLVLGVTAPTAAPGRSLWQSLDTGTLGELGLFALSFAIIARFWMVHHDAVRDLPERVAPAIVLLNFGFLLVLCLIPFSTTLFARNADDMLALVVYTATVAAVSILLAAITSAAHGAITLRSLAIPGIFLLAIPVAVVIGPQNAPWTWLLLFVLPIDRVDAALSRRIR